MAGLATPLHLEARGSQAPRPPSLCTNRQRSGAGAAPTEPPAEPPPPPPLGFIAPAAVSGSATACGATLGDSPTACSSSEDKHVPGWIGWPGASVAGRHRSSGVVTSVDWPRGFGKPSGMSLGPTPPPDLSVIAGCWQDTLGNNVQVPYPPDDPKDPAAVLTNVSRGRREVKLGLDRFGRLWCGNGVLYRIGYPSLRGSRPSHLAWRTIDWRMSVWTRADDQAVHTAVLGAGGMGCVATPAKNLRGSKPTLAMDGPSSCKAPAAPGSAGAYTAGDAGGRQLRFDHASDCGSSLRGSCSTDR